MISFLKVKIKSLAAEAVIIRNLERKHKKSKKIHKMVDKDGLLVGEYVPNPKYRPLPASYEACATDAERDRFTTFWGLRNHRIHEVRPEARCSHIAYGFLRGKAYGQIEDKCWTKPDWKKIREMIERFGPEKVSKERLEAWAAGDNLPPSHWESTTVTAKKPWLLTRLLMS